MIFQKKDEGEDIRGVKDAITNSGSPMPQGLAPEHVPVKSDFFNESIPVHEEVPVVPQPREAPLFVRVEKYRDVLSLIQEMRVFISGIKQLFNILQELENLRIDAIKIMKATINRLERRLVEMDNELLRPKGFELPDLPHAEKEISHVEGSLSDLQSELSKLRKELEGLK